MARTKTVASASGGEHIALSDAEETARDAEEAVWSDAASARTKQLLIDDVVEMDGDQARVMEDLINTLISNDTIALTDLPAAAQAKITERNRRRSQV